MNLGMKVLIASCLLGNLSFSGTQFDLKIGNRKAIIYAPDKRDKPALVISMHGVGIPASWNQGMMKFEALADTANFVVAYPEGENLSWDLSSDKDLNFILAIIDSMDNRYQINRNRVYASGFSMGAMMSWYLSCKIPDKIAAIVPGDGYPLSGLSGCSEVRHVPVLQIYGTADGYYGKFLSDFLPSQIERYGCATTPVKTKPYPVEVNGRNALQLAQTSKSYKEDYGPCEKNGLKSELIEITVDGMVHDWATPDKLNANDDTNYKGKPFDVNGTWEAWNFMNAHSLDGEIVTIPAHRDSVYNGSFADGTSGWTLNVWHGGATGSVVNGEYQVKIDSIGESNYQIQLIQAGLILEQGKYYEVSFDVYAASGRTLEVNVEKDTDPWTSYLEDLQNFDLTTSKTTRTFTFAMEQPTDSSGRLSFNLGASTQTVFLDNISIKSVEKPTAISWIHNSKDVIAIRCDNSLLKMDFKAPQNKKISFNIFDLKGNQMRAKVSQIGQGEIQSWVSDLSQMPRGKYIVQINADGKAIYRSKILNAN